MLLSAYLNECYFGVFCLFKNIWLNVNLDAFCLLRDIWLNVNLDAFLLIKVSGWMLT